MPARKDARKYLIWGGIIMAKGKAKKEKKEKQREKTETLSENSSDMLLNCKPQA